ncbi:polysaccharide pyruvyl transferase family protein [Fibrobacter sp.]|uniref:polysaccharide pyruvyl transferase family protein n=1 Tax=Fibrobacter sp. TaxID=35828 RepID=UPI00388E7C7A
MRIAIVTLPLLNNYGGVLQNYALQIVLKKMGFCVETLDFECKTISWWRYLRSWIKSFFFIFIPGKKCSFARILKKEKRSIFFEDFVSNNIKKTASLNPLKVQFFCKGKYDCYVVGSDQIWRPKYSPSVKVSFLSFIKKEHVKRIAYAASFGVNNWEYTPSQTRMSSSLIKKFDAISVREESGVKLCKDYLNVNASLVLDPTLLLQKEDYLKLCESVLPSTNRYLMAYVLNPDDSIRSTFKQIAAEEKLDLKVFFADSRAALSIPEWLAMFRDAAYVVTDSFHGTIFSIIFEKRFRCVYNKVRGTARFESLLNLYNSGKLDEMRRFSLNWLKNALES